MVGQVHTWEITSVRAEGRVREGRRISWQWLSPRLRLRGPLALLNSRTNLLLVGTARQGKDYEHLYAAGETFIHVALTRLVVRRLASA